MTLGDLLPTAWHATELGDVGEGDNVAVWGAGPGGPGAATQMRHTGACLVHCHFRVATCPGRADWACRSTGGSCHPAPLAPAIRSYAVLTPLLSGHAGGALCLCPGRRRSGVDRQAAVPAGVGQEEDAPRGDNQLCGYAATPAASGGAALWSVGGTSSGHGTIRRGAPWPPFSAERDVVATLHDMFADGRGPDAAIECVREGGTGDLPGAGWPYTCSVMRPTHCHPCRCVGFHYAESLVHKAEMAVSLETDTPEVGAEAGAPMRGTAENVCMSPEAPPWQLRLCGTPRSKCIRYTSKH